MSTPSILIVDDEPDLLQVSALVLEASGFKVETATNGLEALQLLRGGLRPAVVLLDLMMPVMDGWEFRRQQMEDPALASLPVVVLTGDGRAPQKAAALEADAYLSKPVSIDDLLATARRYCPES